MALKNGSHWYTDHKHFQKRDLYDQIIEEIRHYCRDSHEKFIKSYKYNYDDPDLPPIWMVMETLTFGQISRLYDNLIDSDEKKEIAWVYGVVPNLFESWLRSINFVRN